MTKREYVESRILRLTKQWINVAIVLAVFIFMLLAIMDYFTTPEYFSEFVIIRVSISAILILLLVLNFKESKLIQQFILFVGTALCAIAIEIMIIKLGGDTSFYYAGLGIVAIGVLGFIPIDVVSSIAIALIIYDIYLIPILLWDHIESPPAIFVSNNAFLLSTIVIALVWRYFNQKRLVGELSLQYDLAQERAKLEEYSNELERLVEERTRELNKSERLLRFMFDNANDGIVILDPSGEIVDVNKRACEIYGFTRDALIGTNIQVLEAQADRGKWKERIQRLLEGEPLLFETVHYRKDGSKVVLEVSANVLETEEEVLIQAFQRDVTEKRRYQEQLIQSQKMESIGVLAGGIAHDFNNMLAVILGHTEMLLMDEDMDYSAKTKLAKVEKSARSASQLARKLLKLARSKERESRPFDINQLIRETVELMGSNIFTHLKVDCELCEEAAIVEGDMGDIEQVLINLLINARDAMPDGGEVEIKTEIVNLRKGMLMVESMKSGQYVHISVSDTGTGIPSENISKIFEPFFTTKEKGVGTGLGLAMVYGIVKDHCGHIFVESEEGEGSTFHIYLPLALQKAVVGEGEKVVGIKEGENILVIDDDPSVLEYVKEVLLSSGFNVIATDKPLLGMRLFKNNLRKIDLVITDLSMPFMNGTKVMEAIKGMEPSVKFLVISGFLDDYKGIKAHGILKKPFASKDLIQMVHSILSVN